MSRDKQFILSDIRHAAQADIACDKLPRTLVTMDLKVNVSLQVQLNQVTQSNFKGKVFFISAVAFLENANIQQPHISFPSAHLPMGQLPVLLICLFVFKLVYTDSSYNCTCSMCRCVIK